MADPGPRRHRFRDRAAKRGAEPETGVVRLAHLVKGVSTAAALDAAGLHVSDSPVRTLTVLAVTTVGSAAVGATHERRGEERGRELGRQEGLDTGRRLGRATAMLEQSRQLRAGLGREPGSRDQGGR